jgi:hypothetical protein
MKPLSHLKTDLPPSVVKYARHVNPAFVDLLQVFGYGRVFVRARDVWVWPAGAKVSIFFQAAQ